MAATRRVPAADTSPPASTVPGTTPQRQSCERCYKQKLRCTRENNSNGGVCDRCARKRVQCVYSFSMRKGRPSLSRRSNAAPGPKAGMAAKINASTYESTQLDSTASPNEEMSDESHINCASDENIADVDGTIYRAHPGPHGLLNWDETALDVGWSNHDANSADAILTSLEPFEGGGSGLEGATGEAWEVPALLDDENREARPTVDTRSRTRLSPPTTRFRPPTPSHSCHNVSGGGTSSLAPIMKSVCWSSSVITQLSQLSMRLSSLRASSSSLAKAAESQAYCLQNYQQAPLINAAAFASVFTWLARDCDPVEPKIQTSVRNRSSTDCHNSFLNLVSEEKLTGDHGFLHDVFSASNELLKILHQMQAEDAAGQLSSHSETTPSPPPNGAVSQSNTRSGSNMSLWSPMSTNRSRPQSDNMMQIIRHLVMACEALLLEIYMGVLTTLQHDAQQEASLCTPVLRGVQLVLVVNLCAYLIDRQHQAVDSCWAYQSPLTPDSTTGNFSSKLSLSTSQHSAHSGVAGDMTDREALSDMRHQIQQMLAHLRQTLGCT